MKRKRLTHTGTSQDKTRNVALVVETHGENVTGVRLGYGNDNFSGVDSFSAAEQAALYAAFGLDAADQPAGLEPRVVNTGLPDILLPVKDRLALERAAQDEAEVTRLSRRYNAVGVHMFCLDPDGTVTARCRNFAPLYAIPEEAATGTANGALTYYLYCRGLISPGTENRFLQGESMGKPSEVLSRLTETDAGTKIRVGGRAVLSLRCELL